MPLIMLGPLKSLIFIDSITLFDKIDQTFIGWHEYWFVHLLLLSGSLAEYP